MKKCCFVSVRILFSRMIFILKILNKTQLSSERKSQKPLPHCINSKSYNAQKSVSIHSGPDSKVMHSFTTLMCFSQSSVMMMDTSPVSCSDF